MDALAAILTCSLYLDDPFVRGIVDNAHDDPLTIAIPELEADTISASSAPQTLGEAVAKLREVTARGDRPLIGLMQVPVGWASWFGREAEDLFDPCVNVSIGTAMLSEFDYACAKAEVGHASGVPLRTSTARRACVLRRYAETIHMPELATVVMLDVRYQRTRWIAPAEAPIFPSKPERRAWGPDCLFVGEGSASPPRPLERPGSGL